MAANGENGDAPLLRAESGGSFLWQDAPPVSFEWDQVCMKVNIGKKNERQVLSGAHGIARAGQVTAILGPSGGGKTSLLNVLAGRVSLAGNPQVTGRITINVGDQAVESSKVDLAEVSAYIEQDDILYAFSTVRETLMMAARLRLPHLTRTEQAARVQEVIELLGLVPAAETIVGSDRPGQRGVSGGERKRVALGCELLHSPRVVFADEPTSGLDAFQAASVMEALSNLSRQGCTVITSVHQPRSIIVNSFDNIVLMCGGKVAYSGEAGKPCDDFFAMVDAPVPSGYNRADHYLDTISIDYRTEQRKETSQARVTNILAKTEARHKETAEFAVVSSQHGEPVLPRRQPAPLLASFQLLAVRAFREIWRDKLTLCFKIGFNAFFGIIFGLLYWRMPFDQVSFQNRTGICFFMAMNSAFGSTISIAQVIPRQLKIVNRDRSNKLYGVVPFYASQFLVSLPFEIAPALTNGAIVYFFSNLRHGADHFFLFVLLILLENLAGMALGMIMSASFKEPEMVPQLAPAVVLLFLMFSGYFINVNSIPTVLQWVTKISFIGFSFQGLCINEFKGADNYTGPPLPETPVIIQGDGYLRQLGFDDMTVWSVVWKLLVEMSAFHIFAVGILVLRRPTFVKCQAPPPEGA
mmetsp:Transcript_21172/g.47756  ORF Transcript_21172/g.47756 Transcript_21172/m.47756 type:complete len:638 (+) Transcript_21172:38-1951(+)